MKYIPVTNKVWNKLKRVKTKVGATTYNKALEFLIDQIEDLGGQNPKSGEKQEIEDLVEEKSNFDDYGGDW